MPSQPIKKSPHYVAKASYKVMSSECPPSLLKIACAEHLFMNFVIIMNHAHIRLILVVVH